MATTYKVLGQSVPGATDTDLYTVPSATQTVVSTIVIANRDALASTYRIAVRPGGALLSTEHYLAFDVTCPARDTIALTLGITLAASDVITVYASSSDLSFSAFGSEIA